jgi:hypothetical protein
MRTPALVIALMVLATGGTVAALVLGMSKGPTLARGGPVLEAGAPGVAAAAAGRDAKDEAPPEQDTTGTAGGADVEDETGDAADAEEADTPEGGARLTEPPRFIKGRGMAWHQIKTSFGEAAEEATRAYGKCAAAHGLGSGELPETGVVDLKFVGGRSTPRRVQIFNPDFAALPPAEDCLKDAIRIQDWELPEDAEDEVKVRFRLRFAYG